jgi:predicted ATP-grasp superfamily ATP-dependent carboligase
MPSPCSEVLERPNINVGPMIERPAIILVAYSARALASSAAHAGFAPLSIDVFGDDDTRELSLASVKLEGGLSDGLEPDKVAGAVEALLSAHDPVGLVYGSGFEHQPETIAAIALKTRVFGNDVETLKRAKDPVALAQICRTNGVRHPPIAFDPPDKRELWLVKKRGGAGGAHIAPADDPGGAAADRYYQLRVAGESVSALFLASERKAEIIGLSTQWSAPTPASPFRYGGAAGPIDIEPSHKREIARAIALVAAELNLVGLNSVDFLVSPDAVWLVEINPRPGATLDVFDSYDDPLFWRHIAACERRLTRVPARVAFKAAEIVYAPCDMAIREGWKWPDWAVDRSAPGTRIAAGDPLCTALASCATFDLARLCANERAREIVALVREADH